MARDEHLLQQSTVGHRGEAMKVLELGEVAYEPLVRGRSEEHTLNSSHRL